MRIKRWRVNVDWWIRLHQKGQHNEPRRVRPVTALPDDAEVVRVGYDHTGWMFLIVQSATYDDVKDGDVMPEIDGPTLEVVFDDV
jgi:hypothetical protein